MLTAEDAKKWLDAQLAPDELAHYGVLGMRWGFRKDRRTASGITNRRTDREASKDAKEFVQAKLYYGDGAGTRRKLIKAKVEGKSEKDPNYKKAFNYHVENQDVEKRLNQAKGQRARATARAKTAKTSRGLINIARGNYAAVGASLAATAAVVAFIHKTGIDRQVYNSVVNSPVGKTAIRNGRRFVSGLR